MTNIVSLSSSFFRNSPPTLFTLVGDTSGGPPTTRTWTRDGVEISYGGSYTMYIGVKHNFNRVNAFRDSLYQSILTVRAMLPGVYEYAVTNRATLPNMVTARFTIEGIYHWTMPLTIDLHSNNNINKAQLVHYFNHIMTFVILCMHACALVLYLVHSCTVYPELCHVLPIIVL